MGKPTGRASGPARCLSLSSRSVLRRSALAIALAALLLGPGCGGEKGSSSKTTGTAPEKTSKAVTFAELSSLKLGTKQGKVLERLGPPIERERSKPSGVAVKCYRYYAVNSTGTAIDTQEEFRLCYDRLDRLSVKATAPPPGATTPSK